jgi:hypothetical protein
MPTRIDTVSGIPESDLKQSISDFRDFDKPDIVTAVNTGNGTFTIDVTVFDRTPATSGSAMTLDGTMSHFGGPGDPGVTPEEGLSLFSGDADVQANPDLFLPTQPPNTSGLARRLNPDAMYIACRWNLSVTPKSFLKLKTTKVKVTNPANGKMVEARPADTGPALETGRVADLSLGLETALGLSTDKLCHVEIPIPASSQIPPVGLGIAAGLDLTAIESTIFPPNFSRTLAVMTTSNQATYWVTNLVGQDDGGQSLLRHAGDKTDVLLTDTTVFPIKASDQIPAAVADELNKAAPQFTPAGSGPGGTPPQPGDDVNAKEFSAAHGFLGHDTSTVPGTKNGSLACAWAVNQVTRIALGKPISTAEGGGSGNGLGTDGIFAALSAHHTRLNSASDAKSGTIIIAPSTSKTHGHVGIVGAAAGGVRDTKVLSNRSHPGVFADRFTIGTFTDTYTGMGLQVLFFALNKDQF